MNIMRRLRRYYRHLRKGCGKNLYEEYLWHLWEEENNCRFIWSLRDNSCVLVSPYYTKF